LVWAAPGAPGVGSNGGVHPVAFWLKLPRFFGVHPCCLFFGLFAMRAGVAASAVSGVIGCVGVAVAFHEGCVCLLLLLASLGLQSLVMKLFSAAPMKQYRTTGIQTLVQDSPAPTMTTTSSTFRLEWLTVPELKAIAKMKGLPVGGLKGELVEKLTKASHP